MPARRRSSIPELTGPDVESTQSDVVYATYHYAKRVRTTTRFSQVHRHNHCHFEERKGKEEYLYSAIHTMHSLKALRHGSHSFTCKLHHACLSFVTVHQMSPPLTEVADIQSQLTTHLSTRRDKRLSSPIADGLPT